MKILLIGATGQLGGDILRNNPGHEIAAPGRDVVDLARPAEAADAIARMRPDAVINCAAFHNVPRCEEDPAQAFLINCAAVRDLARACEKAGAWLVTFSSDYAFGGARSTPWNEDDLPAPVQIYGITRVAGEHAARAALPERSMVIRTCGLYGRAGARSKGGNFVDGRVADALAGRRIEMACEQIVAPTATDDLSRAVFALIEERRRAPGIYHLVNEGACSWYEFTCEIVRLVGGRNEVVPVDRGGRSGEMRRPLYSVLANTRARALGITLRPWQAALADYLRGKYPGCAPARGGNL